MIGMAEYIEREALKDAFWSACKNCLSEDDIADLIDDAPAADVAPVIHGRWDKSVVIQTDTSTLYDYTCSVCSIITTRESPYCPNCSQAIDWAGQVIANTKEVADEKTDD